MDALPLMSGGPERRKQEASVFCTLLFQSTTSDFINIKCMGMMGWKPMCCTDSNSGGF